MSNPKPFLLVISLLCISAALSPCSAASNGGKPLVTAVTKDSATSLYTSPAPRSRPHQPGHLSVVLLQQRDVHDDALGERHRRREPAVPGLLPRRGHLRAGRFVGVAGLAPSSQSFPAQVARTQKVATKIALCLPSDGKSTTGDSVGVAIFGGGPLIFPDRGDFTTMLAGTTRLHGFNGSPGYFVTATGIAVDQNQAAVGGPLVVGLSSTIPYTALRPDMYGPLVKAFDKAASGPNWSMQRVTPVAPFQLCYNSTTLGQSLLGYLVPQIDLILQGGGSNFTVLGGNSMVQVNANTACLGFLQKKGQVPAAIIGGFQMENRLLVIDDDKKQLGFTTFLNAVGLSCSNFNFTLAA